MIAHCPPPKQTWSSLFTIVKEQDINSTELTEKMEANSVHGSDAPETAALEIAYLFAGSEICP